MNAKKFVAKFNLPVSELFGSGVIASFGSPFAFVLFWCVSSYFSEGNLTFQNAIGVFVMSSVVSLFFTMAITTVIYLMTKLSSIEAVNVGFVSLVCIPGFFIFTLALSESFQGGLVISCFALINALIFMYLAYRWSKRVN
jgi:hypothetical protein